jgi:hypothetical protein
MSTADWYRNGDRAERQARLEAVRKTLPTPVKRGRGRPRAVEVVSPDPVPQRSHRRYTSETDAERDRLLGIIWNDGRAHRCVWCGGDVARERASAHHLVPRGWRYSTDSPANLEIVHAGACHDEIELWTEDHGRPPTPMQLREHQLKGVIHEPVTRYIPRFEATLTAGEALLELLRRKVPEFHRREDGPAVIPLVWSPVVDLVAERLATPEIRFVIGEPRPGDTAEAFYTRNGLHGLTFPSLAPRPGPHDLAGASALSSRDEAIRTEASDGVSVPQGPRAELPPSARGVSPSPVPTASSAARAHRLRAAERDVRPDPISAGDRSTPNLGLL